MTVRAYQVATDVPEVELVRVDRESVCRRLCAIVQSRVDRGLPPLEPAPVPVRNELRALVAVPQHRSLSGAQLLDPLRRGGRADGAA